VTTFVIDRLGCPLGTNRFAYCTKRVIGIAAGLLYIYSQGFIHRDMKPQNILLDEKFDPTICDFGRARVDSTAKSVMVLRPLTSAPEAIDQVDTYTNNLMFTCMESLCIYFSRERFDSTTISRSEE
jgi:serine/threonine protein kinase